MFQLPSDHAALLMTPAEKAAADQAAVRAGVSLQALMQAAGQAVARRALAAQPDGPVLVLAGPGNNGGDGYVAATALSQAGRDVRVAALGDPSAASAEAAAAAAAWTGPTTPLAEAPVEEAALIVDALFGAGLSRPLDGAAADAVTRANRARAHRLAVDMPSGVDGTSGQVAGPAFRAHETITFERACPGHFLVPGAAYRGRLTLAGIGWPAAARRLPRPGLAQNHPSLWHQAWPPRDPLGHKYHHGHAVMVGGRAPMLGASRLTAMAALRAGAGLVSLTAGPLSWPIQAAALTAVMVQPVWDLDGLRRFLADPRKSALMIGPGAGRGSDTRARVQAVLRLKRPTVLDADALTAFEGRADKLFRALHAGCVLTPHGGEYGRLFGTPQGDRLDHLRAAASRAGAVVVLKGAETAIADPGAQVVLDFAAQGHMATAGTGDILTGLIGGLLAQGVPAAPAAAIGVRLQRLAGQAHGEGMIAGDLLKSLPAAMARWRRAAGGSALVI